MNLLFLKLMGDCAIFIRSLGGVELLLRIRFFFALSLMGACKLVKAFLLLLLPPWWSLLLLSSSALARLLRDLSFVKISFDWCWIELRTLLLIYPYSAPLKELKLIAGLSYFLDIRFGLILRCRLELKFISVFIYGMNFEFLIVWLAFEKEEFLVSRYEYLSAAISYGEWEFILLF